MTATILHGDCLDILRGMPDNSVDAIVTDPPYGLSNTTTKKTLDALTRWLEGDRAWVPHGRGFQDREWDKFVPPPAVWDECLRVLKPGGHMAVFSGARTQDLMGLSIRLAGFDLRESLGWVYSSGFPKSQDVSKAIDKRAGVEREIIGYRKWTNQDIRGNAFASDKAQGRKRLPAPITAPATEEAKHWDGWGTALKPAIEPIILARKPLDGTVVDTVLRHGTGAINVGAARVPGDDGESRFPSTVLLDEAARDVLEEQAPGAGRYFTTIRYQSKAPKKERPALTREDGTVLTHPTVKPESLLEWLCTLVVPEGGVVLDPFAGSGTTGQAACNLGFTPVLIERDRDYVDLIHHRLGRGDH